MSSSAPTALARHVDRRADHDPGQVDHNFLPDFGWAAVGGVVTLVACALILMLTVSSGGGPSVASYNRELAGGFLAGFLVVLVARSLSTKSS